jgi:c-di-GMP-binding flagellar brake protein YcgR
MRLDECAKIGEIFEVEAGKLQVHTKLLDFLEGEDFAVLQPTIKGAPLRTQDKIFTFSFFRPEGVYEFEAEMVTSYIKDDIHLCRFRQTTEIKKIQRRQYYRLPIVLDIILTDESEKEDRKQYKCKTITLSENSVQLTCFTPLEEETPVSVKIPVSSRETISMHGKVLRCTEPQRKTEPYEMVVLFAQTARFRPRLSRYIFTQQIIARNKKQKHI